MLKPLAPISQFMSPVPAVAPATALSDALEIMANAGIRHLPVVDDGRVVGLLTANAALAMDEFGMFTSADGPVEGAMASDPPIAPASCPLRDVVHTMAHEGLTAVLVVEGSELRGLFTDADALKLLADALAD